MCSDNTVAFLRALPKNEVHLHIEGTFEPALLLKLAKRNGISLDAIPEKTVEELNERYTRFTSLDDFLHYYNLAMAALITEEDFEELTFAYMERVHGDGLVHAEIFFDPQAHVERGIPLADVVSGIHKGLMKGQEQFGITSKLIMCFVRHLPVQSAIDSVKSIMEYVKTGQVHGLGCDSTELGNPPEKYKEVYQLARDLGMKHLTMHSGEEGPAAWVRTTVEDLGILRIDHGVRSADDPEVLKMLAERGAFLTVCPLSNVRLCVHKDVSESPIPLFMKAGVKFSINSDDPAYFGGYILDNYLAVQKAFNFSKETWKGLCTDAVNGSWCNDGRKKEILAKLDEVMAQWADKDL